MSAAGGWRRGIELFLVLAVLGLAACDGGHGSSFTPAGPVLDPIADQQVEPTRSLVLRLTASNPDDQRLTYSSTTLPPNADLVPSTGLFVFTPGVSQAGASYSVTFTVSDGRHQDSATVRVGVTTPVPPANRSPILAPIGDHEVHVGETLTLQQHAIDPDGNAITFSVHPPLPDNASYDSHSGLFTFAPSADQLGDYPLSFIADDGYNVDYETVHVAVRAQTPSTPSATNAPPGTPTPTSTAACQVAIPTGCIALAPSDASPSPSSSATPTPPPDLSVDRCYTVSSGSYTYRYVNVVDGGQLIFVDDGGTIDFRVGSLLVEQGGSVQAGSLECPFGSANGKLEIGLWGTDPTEQGTNQSPAFAGITCVGHSGNCYDTSLTTTPHYCVQPTPPATPTATWSASDPCDVTIPSNDENLYGNAFFEGYEALNFDYGKSYFGYKVFAVSYGGSLQLFGRKGVADADLSPEPQTSCDTPHDQYDLDQWAQLSGSSWARLDNSVSAGQTTITIDRAVDWNTGDKLVIGTTDWYPSHSEEVQVQAASTAGGQTTLTLSAPLLYAHNGDTYPVPPTPGAKAGNPNTALELRAPVGLLSRSILIYSLGKRADEPFPNPASGDWENCSFENNSDIPPAHPECYFGGQLMVRQGFDTFQIQGVEMRQLGQGGRQGHYPMHWHMVKSTDYTDAYVKDCSIWDSMDRFVVLHATHGVNVSRNVGYMSVGHGFYLEDGSEIENMLCQNLAVSVRGSFDEFFENQPSTSPSYRYVPPIIDGAEQEVEQGYVFGGDTLLPVAYWTMNTWNELVGNAAAGVYGFGSCYWFLGSGVSGPSQDFTWTEKSDTPADYAGFNVAGTQQAPVKRFRGNSCSGATYGLQTTLEVQPTGNTADQTGYTPATNPYIQCENCEQACSSDPTSPACMSCKPGQCAAGQFDRPMAEGNFLPVKYGDNPSCASGLPEESLFSTNPDYCVTTLIDRFTTSFNHPGADFGAVWLRPQWFVFMNSAITDQLGGGLGFITGGSWTQTPPGYFSITKNSVFVGSTQIDNPDASAAGPNLCPSPTPSSTCAQNCDAAGGAMCILPADGIALFTGGLNSKRMISIYDGPFYADGSVFTDTEPFVCETTGPAPFSDQNSCQIYSSSTEPQHPLSISNGTPTPTGSPTPAASPQMKVVNAAVGWKQPNGFYYPPAFAFRKTGFDADTFRHNVIDQYATYLQGSLASPTGQPTAFSPLGVTYPGITPIDFSTILNDMDGTLTGWQPEGGTRTSSVSKNAFFNAPSQDAECKSFGVQTSPYEFVSSVIAPLGGTSPNLYVDSNYWGIASTPAVPIYRQLVLPDDQCVGDQSVCCASPYMDCAQGTVGCTRGSFMLGGQGGQAPYLTSNNGVYYVDTNQQETNPSCFQNPTVSEPGFAGGQAYVLYNLFANENTNITYQLYVGDDFNNCSDGQWVLVQPHVYSGSGNNTTVTPITDNAVLSALNAGVSVNNGVLQAVFDHSAIKDAYLFSNKPDYDVCLPRDICQIDTTTSNSCTIQTQTSFLDGNATDFADYKTDVTSICTYWATATAGRVDLPNTPGDDADDPLFADCPAGGCLGYMFTLPSTFAAKKYEDVGAALTGCFDASWNVAMDRTDADCPNPATPNPTAFCPAGSTPTPAPNMPCATLTATGGTPPTFTATSSGDATPTPTSGGVSPIPTGPGATPTGSSAPQTPTPIPGTVTSTPTAAAPTPTSTPAPTPSGPLVWVLNASPLAQLTGISTGGATYSQGQLAIQDSDKRFCTSAGTTPQVQVKVSSVDLLTVGLYPTITASSVDVAALPAAPAGTYDVVIQTFPNCDSSKPPIDLTMPSAIVYQ